MHCEEERGLPVIGCIIMASGYARRYGRNKLLEPLGDCCVAERVCRAVLAAEEMSTACRWDIVVVTRWEEIVSICRKLHLRYILHQDLFQSDTIRRGLDGAEESGWSACLFVQADQPLIRPESIRKTAEEALRHPGEVVRLAWRDQPGSPAVFPADLFPQLCLLEGEKGGRALIRSRSLSCRLVQASGEEEMMDVDTPEELERIRRFSKIF